ncbi:MAG TPA: RagB/SusD family nutrient uptake outer membrane protein [Chitinophagaceae bacterium]|nr:RagB/SusD family nutrient uptake outer membrane protein [Chitinophagaceae bacterium]
MKRSIIKIFSIITVGLVLFSSCAKKIDIKPEFQLDGSKKLATIEEAENVLTGAYTGFLGLYTGPYSDFPDMMSDDFVETFESLGNFQTISQWSYVSNDPLIDATWRNSYSIISSVNIILRDIDGLAGENPGAANRIKGQALAIRAHTHFDLLRYFAPTFGRNSTDLGVPYVTTYDPTAKPARNTVKEVYDHVLADLAEAATAFSNIDHAVNSASNRGRLDIAGVRAIQARVNLYAGQWADAVTAATAAINLRPLSNINDFPYIWVDEEFSEVIWTVNFETATDGLVYGNIFFAPGNRNVYKPTSQGIAIYDQANDVRYDSYFGVVGTLNDVPKAARLIEWKHLGRTATDGVVNWKEYRTGEMYLIRAEANYKLNNEAAALADLNTLRSNRIFGFIDGTESGAALLDAIMTERRKELYAEGHRFFDLKRTVHVINRCPSNAGSPSTICSLASNSRAWTWPIPFNETNANPNIIQNNGY